MPATVRLLSVRVLLMLLAVALGAVALAATLTTAPRGHHDTTLGSGRPTASRVAPTDIVWN